MQNIIYRDIIFSMIMVLALILFVSLLFLAAYFFASNKSARVFSSKEILKQIKKIASGTVIPKIEAKSDFIIKGWGNRRGEEALIYTIPNHKEPSRPYEKGITASEWMRAYQQLKNYGEFSRDWFDKNMPECAKEGACNFTTIGGIFQLLGIAVYHKRGAYVDYDKTIMSYSAVGEEKSKILKERR